MVSASTGLYACTIRPMLQLLQHMLQQMLTTYVINAMSKYNHAEERQNVCS